MIPPPRIPRLLLGRLAPGADRDYLLGDLDEEFAARSRDNPRAARRWYWRQAISSALPLTHLALRGAPRPTAVATGDSMWLALFDDLRYAVRLARRSPLATSAVVLTMVLGIGVTTSVFSVVNGILLKPLPFAASERVVRFGSTLPSGQVVTNMAYPDMQDYMRDTRSISDYTMASPDHATLTQGSEPQQIATVAVSSGYSQVFDIHPILGRLFTGSDFQWGSHRVAVLSHAFWHNQFSEDRNIVGRTISLNNEPYQVIGVLPATAYTYPQPDADVLLPLALAPGSFHWNRGALWVEAFGRLRPGATLATARAELGVTTKRIEHDFPVTNGQLGLQVEPVRDRIVGDVRPMLVLLSISVAAVLLIACVNIGNLLLGQSQRRSREFAVRAALGGSGSRIAGQLLVESVLLSVAGGLLGLAAVRPLTRLFVHLYPGELPRAAEIAVDAHVWGVAAIATLCAGALASLPSIRRAFALNLVRDLRDGNRAGSNRAQRRVGAALVISQVALSLALLFAAGLLLQSFRHLESVDPGFAPSNLTTFQLNPAAARHANAAAVQQFYADLERGLRQIPGVENVAVGTDLPLGNASFGDVFVDDTRGDQGDANPHARRAFVNPGYWATLGVPVLAGRTFTAEDDSASAGVMVINQALARRYYPGVDPVGRSLSWNYKHWRVVGVVGTMHMDNMTDDPEPAFYAPSTQIAIRSRFVGIKSRLPAGQIIAQARQLVNRLDPTIALTDIATMTERVHVVMGPQRFRAAMVAALGVLALTLSIIGIYGVVAYDVGRQTRDIGIRMALGEDAMQSTWRVVLQALQPALIGATFGIALALVAGRALASLLIGIRPWDVSMLGAAAALMLVVAALAAYVPARRASRVDPLTAMRGD